MVIEDPVCGEELDFTHHAAHVGQIPVQLIDVGSRIRNGGADDQGPSIQRG